MLCNVIYKRKTATNTVAVFLLSRITLTGIAMRRTRARIALTREAVLWKTWTRITGTRETGSRKTRTRKTWSWKTRTREAVTRIARSSCWQTAYNPFIIVVPFFHFRCLPLRRSIFIIHRGTTPFLNILFLHNMQNSK